MPAASLFPKPMRSAATRSAHFFFVFASLLITCSCVAVAEPPRQSQDPNAKPAPAPAAQRTPAASSNPSSHTSTGSSPLQKAVHQKKVITEDDLAKPTKAISVGDLEGEENNPTCDLSCEAELRSQIGLGPEREPQFRSH